MKYENRTKPPPPHEILLHLVVCIINHLTKWNARACKLYSRGDPLSSPSLRPFFTNLIKILFLSLSTLRLLQKSKNQRWLLEFWSGKYWALAHQNYTWFVRELVFLSQAANWHAISPMASCHGNPSPSDPMESGSLPTCISTKSATLYFAVYLLSLSRTDFRWVWLFVAFVHRTQFGCIAQPSSVGRQNRLSLNLSFRRRWRFLEIASNSCLKVSWFDFDFMVNLC